MATINGTAGNDTLSTNTFTNDDFFGFGGNDIYEYVLDGGDDTITDSAGNDELNFGAGISFYAMSFVRDGNNLVIRTAEAGTVTIIDHFVSSSDQVETVSFDSDPSVDLTYAHSYFLGEKQYYMGAIYYDALYLDTDNNDVTVYASLTQTQYDEWYLYGLRNNNSSPSGILTGNGNNTVYANYVEAYLGSGDDVIYTNWIAYMGGGDDIINGTSAMNSGGIVFGQDGNDIFYGSSGYEQYWGDSGEDTLYGNAGDDTLYGNDGNDVLYGGDGDDSLIGDDYSTATTGNDIIYCGEGNDVIYGGSGDDLVYGENGNDIIETGDGDDILYCGNGNDNVGATTHTTSGTRAATGNKEIHGGSGNDYIVTDIGNDSITGDDGTDTIWGGGGNDNISGGNGNDEIGLSTSSLEIATAYGDDGNDILWFAPLNYTWGEQHLYGGNDNDTYYTDLYTAASYGNIGNIEIYDLSGSADVFSTIPYLNNLSTDVTFTISGNNLLLTYNGRAGGITFTDFFIIAHRIESFEFSNKTGSLFETLTNLGTTYTATSSTSHLGLDTNFIEALGGNDTVNAGIGDDAVWGGTGDDILNGQDGNDHLYGEAGNDTLRGGLGDDYLDGGADFDTASYSTATAAVTVNLATGTSSGPDGSDTFVSIEGIAGSAYADSLTGDSNNNTITGNNGNDTIYGGAGADLLYGNANNDTIYGEDGDDTLFGGAGNDTLNGGNGTDTANYTEATSAVTVSLAVATGQAVGGGQGTDTLSNIENLTGSSYNDTLTGNTGSNVLAGNNGNDTLNGGDGNDYLFGDNGNDTLNGGNNDDYLVGGAGDDAFNGGSGTDMARFINATAGVTVDILAGTATGEGTDTLSGIENVEGSAYADTITGNTAANFLQGGAGNDSLYGGDGLDVLYGQTGADTFTLKGETAFNNVDEIGDFVNGTGGDFINIADVLSDYGFNPLTDLLSDWVATSLSGSNTLLQVDRDGTGGTYSMQSIAQIDGVNLTLTDLTTDGNLIT